VVVADSPHFTLSILQVAGVGGHQDFQRKIQPLSQAPEGLDKQAGGAGLPPSTTAAAAHMQGLWASLVASGAIDLAAIGERLQL
jgi:hypothetical protein